MTRTGTRRVTPAPVRELTDSTAARVVVTAGVCFFLLGSLLPPLNEVSLTLAAIPFVVLPLALSVIGPRRSPRIVLLAALALFAVLTYKAYSGPPPLEEYGMDKQFRLVTSTFLSALSAAVIFSFDRLRTFARWWVVVATGIALLTIASGQSFSVGRASVFDNNPIWLARAFASGTLFAIALPWMGARRWWRWACIPLILALVLTGSRGPAIGLAVALAVLLIRNATRLIATLVAALGTYLAFTMIPALSATRIGQTISETGAAGTNTTRFEMWASAWRIWRENPSGVGIGNWANYSGIEPFSWPHDLWLEVASELGTVAIVALLATVVLTFRGLIRNVRWRSEYRLVLALLTAEAVAVSLSGDLSARTFFFLLFLGVGMNALAKGVTVRRSAAETSTTTVASAPGG